MKKYTIEEFSQIIRCKHYLNFDRFSHYFMAKFELSEHQTETAYKVFQQYPTYAADEEYQKLLNRMLPHCFVLVQQMESAWERLNPISIDYDDKYIQKLVYKSGDKHFETVFDLHCIPDLIVYAEMLKNTKIEPIKLLPLSTTWYNDGKDIQIFVGDIFDTTDRFYGNKSNLFVAQEKGQFQKLLYIKGKGYVQNKKPNFDTERTYNNYVIKTEHRKIGNIHIDFSMLFDDVPEE